MSAATSLPQPRRATGCLSSPRIWVSRLVARPGASACRAARRAASHRLLRLRRASGCLGMSHGSSSTTSPTSRARVPRHVAWLVVDYFAYAARLGASACRAPRRRLLCLARLVIDYFAYAARPGASARRAARRRLLRLHHEARRAARRRLLYLRRAIRCLGSLHGSSSTFAYVVRPGASAPRTARRRSCAVSPLDFSLVCRTSSCCAPGCSVSRLDYSVRGRRDFVLQPHWLHFSHAVRSDYLSRDNTGCTSSTPRAATTSSSSRIASTTHLD
jgi:hypothetical protein